MILEPTPEMQKAAQRHIQGADYLINEGIELAVEQNPDVFVNKKYVAKEEVTLHLKAFEAVLAAAALLCCEIKNVPKYEFINDEIYFRKFFYLRLAMDHNLWEENEIDPSQVKAILKKMCWPHYKCIYRRAL